MKNNSEEFKKIQGEFQKYNIKTYIPNTSDDLLILRWWMYLTTSGEIERLINYDSHGLGNFFPIFKHPTYLAYQANEAQDSLLQTHWLKPASNHPEEKSAYNGVWVHPSMRGAPSQLIFVYLTYRAAFCFFDSILGTTWQPELIDLHIKMGYDVVGVVPDFLGHEKFFFVRVTQESFMASKVASTAERMLQRRS